MSLSESFVNAELIPPMRNIRLSNLVENPMGRREPDSRNSNIETPAGTSTTNPTLNVNSTSNVINNNNNNNKDVALSDTVEYRVIHARDERAAGHHHHRSHQNNTSTDTISKNAVSAEDDEYEPAGHMRAVIPSSGVLVVQTANSPAILEELLDNGTPMFERCVRYTSGGMMGGPREEWYRQIGIVEELFGTVSEPMYALRLEPGIRPDSLLMGSNVFYMPRHAETRFIRLRLESNGSYSVEHEEEED